MKIPTSYPHTISPLLERIIALNPRSVLDVGVGYGKWGWLCREYLDDFSHELRLDGVEVWRSYVDRTPASHLYDLLLVADFPADTVTEALAPEYELVLMIDTLEHYTPEDGLRAIAKAHELSPCILLSTPVNYPQGAVNGNPYETHRSQWTPGDLAELGDFTDFSDDRSTMGLLRRRA